MLRKDTSVSQIWKRFDVKCETEPQNNNRRAYKDVGWNQEERNVIGNKAQHDLEDHSDRETLLQDHQKKKFTVS